MPCCQMPTQTAFSHPVLLLAGLLLVIGTAPGDEVKLKRRPAFRNVQIIDYTGPYEVFGQNPFR